MDGHKMDYSILGALLFKSVQQCLLAPSSKYPLQNKINYISKIMMVNETTILKNNVNNRM